ARATRAHALSATPPPDAAPPAPLAARFRSSPRLLARAVRRMHLVLRVVLGAMPRQENIERRALAFLRVDIDEAAGLLDDTVYGRKPETGALADFLGREERLEDLVDDIGRDSGAGIRYGDPHVIRRRHPLVGEMTGLLRAHVGGPNRQLAAVGHRVAGVD